MSGSRRPVAEALTRAGSVPGRAGWLERTLAGLTANVEQAVFTERLARSPGWLQRRDPRAKVVCALLLLLAAGLTSSLAALALLHGATLLAARASRVPLGFFVRRVWLGVPLFAALVVVPALFLTPGQRVFQPPLGPPELAPTWNGLSGGVLLVCRVGVSVSLAVLLVLTTPWSEILKSLRALGVPQAFVLVLSMTYRYLFLFLHTVNGVLLARKSRVVGRSSGTEQRRWIVGTIGNLLSRAFKMSNDVYAAMLARGFSGEVRTWGGRRLATADWLGLAGALGLATCVAAVGSALP